MNNKPMTTAQTERLNALEHEIGEYAKVLRHTPLLPRIMARETARRKRVLTIIGGVMPSQIAHLVNGQRPIARAIS